MARTLPLLSLALAAAACTRADARESLVTIDTLPGGIPSVTTASPVDSGRWALVPERVIQPGQGEPGELLDPQDVAIGEDGTVIVAESGPATVHVFDGTGKFLRDIGRQGEGPGEFRTAFIGIRGDSVVVQDPQNIRATTYSLSDGHVIASRPTVCCYWAPITIDNQGRAVARMMSGNGPAAAAEQGFLRFPIGGTTAESLTVREHPEPDDRPSWTIGDGKRMMMRMAVPMQPRSSQAVAPSGEFVVGWGGEYRLWSTANGTDTTRIFGRPWTPAPVTAEEKAAIVDRRVGEMLGNGMNLKEEQLRKSMVASAIPDTRPAFEGIWVDPGGKTWVRLIDSDTSAMHLDLFDPEGRWLDQVVVREPEWASSGYRPVAFSSDRLAVLATDDDGLPLVRIYRITRSER